MEERGKIFSIERFSIHDGPGIRTSVFFQGCSLRCAWCHNPESWQAKGPVLQFLKADCIGCMACAAVCPADALRKLGTERSVPEVMEEVIKDRPYYGAEGGVTLSGGEPLLQADFAAALLKECKKHKISTCVETAGFVPWEAFEKVQGLTDLFLFDYKLDIQEEMDRYTGGKLETVLDNLRRLAALGKKIVLRCPVIPGINDTDGHFRAIARLAKECRIPHAELMPYHNWGEPKWEQVGRPYGLSGLKTMTQQEADACRARLDEWMKAENGEE